MPKLPVLTSKELLRILQEFGFEVDHVTGSHYILYRKEDKARTVVPYHKKDLPAGTLLSILRTANISKEELEEKL